jgi:hypothetical protein
MTDWICIVSLFDITMIDLKSPLSYSMIYVARFSVGHFHSTIIQTLQDSIGLLHLSMKR